MLQTGIVFTKGYNTTNKTSTVDNFNIYTQYFHFIVYAHIKSVPVCGNVLMAIYKALYISGNYCIK